MPERTCQTCGKKFEHKKQKKYCSWGCDPRRHKNCKVCGSEFFDNSKFRGRKYCSDKCNPNTRKSRDKTCGYCGENFHDDSKQNSMFFCDPSCRRKAKVVRAAERKGEEPPEFLDEQIWQCSMCDTEYTPKASNQLFCSVACREDLAFRERYADVPDHLPRKVECLECGESFRGCIPHGGRSGNHFKDVHNMTAAEYQVRHPEALIYCLASAWKQRQKTWEATQGQRETYSQSRLAYYEENDVWNKGLTAEDHPGVQAISESATERLSIPENNPFYGKTHSEEFRRERSQLMKEKWQDEDFRSRMFVSMRKTFQEDGFYISGPHQAMIDAMQEDGLYAELGFGYEVFVTLLDGSPHPIDIASREAKIAIEIDGCFYHGCPYHGSFEKLSSDWQESVTRTQVRDELIDRSMETYGWTIIRVWEHEITEDISSCVNRIREVQ